jgi:hypothetical protein
MKRRVDRAGVPHFSRLLREVGLFTLPALTWKGGESKARHCAKLKRVGKASPISPTPPH